MKKFLSALLVVLMTLTLFGCDKTNDEEIVVLFTNDVHCGIDENIGYAGLAAYKKSVQANHKYVAMVDCGDAIQGDVIGTVSQGEYLVQIMNEIGYNFATFGNHEFDYSIDRLQELLGKANAKYLACNINYSGSQTNKLGAAAAYAIEKYGKFKVAFIGVATPESIVKSTPTYFQENGEYVYDFTGSSIDALAAKVQETVKAAKKAGADFVIVLSHLGDDESSAPFTSTELAAKTSDIDVILDGHSHSTVPSRVLTNSAGKSVCVASTGTKLAAIGQLTISTTGEIATTLITDYAEKDADMTKFVENIKTSYEALVNQKVFTSEIKLGCKNEDGIRLVRTRETAIGDLCADAYRYNSGADIAFVNGGGIRADINAGDVTYANVISVHPFGNMLTVVEATGQEILDALEMASRNTQSVIAKDGNATGENGGFLQVSGLKYTINTAIESSVVLNEQNEFVEITGARRVEDVMVLNKTTNEYEPIDPAKTYTLASHNYMLKSGGDGINMFIGNKILMDESKIDNQVLIDYIQKGLNGVIGNEYSQPQGRITVK